MLYVRTRIVRPGSSPKIVFPQAREQARIRRKMCRYIWGQESSELTESQPLGQVPSATFPSRLTPCLDPAFEVFGLASQSRFAALRGIVRADARSLLRTRRPSPIHFPQTGARRERSGILPQYRAGSRRTKVGASSRFH